MLDSLLQAPLLMFNYFFNLMLIATCIRLPKSLLNMFFLLFEMPIADSFRLFSQNFGCNKAVSQCWDSNLDRRSIRRTGRPPDPNHYPLIVLKMGHSQTHFLYFRPLKS